MSRRASRAAPAALDTELPELPPELRWREWMGRIEAAIFAAAAPVPREMLARLVGRDCVLDDLIADIRDELRGRPYDLVEVAGGWQHRTRPRFLAAIRLAIPPPSPPPADLSPTELQALGIVAYHQPITRARISALAGRPVSRDTLAWLRQQGFIATGPRLAEPGAPATYVTTGLFLHAFGLRSLRDLPEYDALEPQAWPDGEPLTPEADIAGPEQDIDDPTAGNRPEPLAPD